MQTTTVSHLPVPVSRLGLGCMGMSEFYGQSDDRQSLQVLAAALEQGINFFDTADTYGNGHNERLLGQFLQQQRGRRAQMVIADKFGIVRMPGQYERQIDNSPAYIRRACEASLKRLGTDYLDLYYCHRRNPDVPIEAVVETMAALVQEGKVRALGLSEVNAQTLTRAHAVHPISCVQSEYSLWSRQAEADVLPTAQALGITFVAYSPLGRAFLTGTLRPENLSADDFRRALPRLQAQALKHNQGLVDALSQRATQWGYSNAQLCLAWLMNRHPHLIPIVGMRKTRYLQENCAATEIHLSAEQRADLNRLFAPERVHGARYPENGWAGIES